MSSIADLKARRAKVMPQLRHFYTEPLHLVEGRGVWLKDADGKRYLDCYNNVASVGHCHPKVLEALKGQASLLNTHTRYFSSTVVEYAERLAATTGDSDLSVVLFVNSGSEANDLAIRLAKKFTGKRGAICSEYAYHGITDAVDAFTPACSSVRQPQMRYMHAPNLYRYTQAELNASLDDCIKSLVDSEYGLAMALFDSMFMSDGILEAPPGFLKHVAESVQRAGGLYIADEVQSGFGRTGKALWGYQLHGVKPDIITLGKPMGNGFPIGAVITRPDIIKKFITSDNRMFFSTFGGNNVAAAVGLAVLNVIRDERLVDNADQVGCYFKSELQNLQLKHRLIGQVRGHGLALGVELVKDRQTKEPATAECEQLVNILSKKLLMGREGAASNTLKIRPPIVFSKENVDFAVAAIDAALTQVEQRSKL